MLAMLLSLIITLVYGKRLIKFISRKIGGSETVRELGLSGEQSKKNTPTMGGILIIMGILIPTLLFARLDTIYIIIMLVATVWLGIIGFIDDYLKLRAKRIAQEQGIAYKKGDKDGLAGWFKILGQVGLGIFVGATLYFNADVRIWREYRGVPIIGDTTVFSKTVNNKPKYFVETKVPVTTIPFVKSHEFNYSKLLPASWRDYTWILYICLLYTSPSPRDRQKSRMPSSA